MSTDDDGDIFLSVTKESFLEGVADIKKALDKPLLPSPPPFKGELLTDEQWLEICNVHKEGKVVRIGKPVNLLSMPIVPRKTRVTHD